jgi:hypothetical protein
MPDDPVRVEEAGAWLAKAAQDLRVAEHEVTIEPPFLEDVLLALTPSTRASAGRQTAGGEVSASPTRPRRETPPARVDAHIERHAG